MVRISELHMLHDRREGRLADQVAAQQVPIRTVGKQRLSWDGMSETREIRLKSFHVLFLA